MWASRSLTLKMAGRLAMVRISPTSGNYVSYLEREKSLALVAYLGMVPVENQEE